MMARITGKAKRTPGKRWFVALMGTLLLLLMVARGLPQMVEAATTNSWSAYMGNNQRSGYNAAETIINPTSAPNLKLKWTHKAGGAVTTQPTVANGMVYWGSWDGIEHASSPATGKDIWTANLGQTIVTCSKIHHGVLSSAAFATLSIKGVATPALLLGGGNVQMYALNANTGAVIWHTPLGTQPDFFLYGSPAVSNGSVYMGVSSHGDCPLVQGQLVQLSEKTGAIQHTFNVVPDGCTGGSVWTAPTIDTATQLVYFSTGNEGTCSSKETQTDALIAVRAKDLSQVGSWQVPAAQQIVDGDFGSTPTLFQATIGGALHKLVGLENKNGIYYTFDRATISAGPLWQQQLGQAPGPGGDNIASSAWNNVSLFTAAASTTINGVNCAGSLRSLNPATGAFIWQDCLSFDPRGTVTMVPGLAEVGAGTSFIVVNATTGAQLFSYSDTANKSDFLGPCSIANGQLYQGNIDGNLYAFGP
ncbi:MAG TPA: PQQ-binding-like beta-propeller repeat protein [Ktedonobacteraceae bacterium]|nr:PQQ-binding-like beta-propeller repeat protein [Ktedonobacteraceae bacterium]